MSETKWTPGPWRVDEAGLPDLVRDDYHFIDAGRGYYNRDESNGFGLSGVMSLADAQLIAAAPEMAEALYRCDEEMAAFDIEAVCDHDVGICWCSWKGARQLLRAALAKIEGRTP